MKTQPLKITLVRHIASGVVATTLTLSASLFCATAVHATDGTWNSGGGDGDWTNSAKWNGGTVASGTDATATLDGTSGNTLTLTEPTTIGNIIATNWTGNPSWKIAGSTLTLDVTSDKPIINISGDGSTALEINSVLTGTEGFILQGNGRLSLNASNTLTGGIIISNSGTIVTDANALNGNSVTFNGSSSGIQLKAGTYTGGLILGSSYAEIKLIGSAAEIVLSGVISETGGSRSLYLMSNGDSGRYTLQGNNSYTGDTRIGRYDSLGYVIARAENNNAFGTGAAFVYFDEYVAKSHDYDTVELANNVTISDKSLTLRGQGADDAGSLRSVSGTNTWAGDVNTGTYTNTTAAYIGVDTNSLTISGAISGVQGVTKVGDGLLVLSASNNYAVGTHINAGTLRVENDQALAGGHTTVGDGTGTDTLRLAGGVQLAAQNFSLTSSAHLAFDLTGGFTATQILVAGDQLGSGTYTVDIYDGGGLTNGTYTLMTVTGATNAAGFTLGNLPGGYESSTLSWSGDKLTLNAIPEPSMGLLLAMGAGLTLLLRRLKKASTLRLSILTKRSL